MKKLILFSLALIAMSLTSATANAGVVSAWGGAGTSGTDPFGNPWSLNSDGWGMPGVGAGNIPWGGNVPVSDFHITFDLPTGVVIDQTGSNDVFRLAPFSGGQDEWDMTVMNGNTIWFEAPDPSLILQPGQNFFVNVSFSQPLSVIAFEATWTDDHVVVPEPSTFALLGIGGLALVGYGVRRQRQQAA